MNYICHSKMIQYNKTCYFNEGERLFSIIHPSDHYNWYILSWKTKQWKKNKLNEKWEQTDLITKSKIEYRIGHQAYPYPFAWSKPGLEMYQKFGSYCSDKNTFFARQLPLLLSDIRGKLDYDEKDVENGSIAKEKWFSSEVEDDYRYSFRKAIPKLCDDYWNQYLLSHVPMIRRKQIKDYPDRFESYIILSSKEIDYSRKIKKRKI